MEITASMVGKAVLGFLVLAGVAVGWVDFVTVLFIVAIPVIVLVVASFAREGSDARKALLWIVVGVACCGAVSLAAALLGSIAGLAVALLVSAGEVAFQTRRAAPGASG